jgi:hypothetical protein
MDSEITEPSTQRSVPVRLAWKLREWLGAQREVLLDYVIILTIFVVVMVSMIMLRQQFFPDSAHYLAMSLWFSGMSQEDALQAVLHRSVANGYEPNTSVALLFDWGLVKPRVVLPLLSVPFIWIFGQNGLAVTTAIITFILVFMLYKFLSRLYGRVASVVSIVLMLSSMSITIFSFGMLTESLSALWGVLTLAFAYRYQKERTLRWIVGLVIVTVLSGFTRQATFIVAGAFVVAWLFSLFSRRERRNWGIPALAVAGTALVVQVAQTLLFPFSQGDQYMRMTGTDSLWGALLATPALVKKILVEELVSYVLDDQVLVILILLSAISMVVFWRRTESHLLFGALLGIALYNITNGNATHFRYAIPGLVFFLASVSLLLNQLQVRVSQNRVGTASLLETPIGALPHS